MAGTERTTSYASEIINHDLELAQLQVDAEAEENETQTVMTKVDWQDAMAKTEMKMLDSVAKAKAKAEILKKKSLIQAKLRKQQSLGSDYSGKSLRSNF